VRRVLAPVALALIVLTACGGMDRPEGAVERWLISLNQGKAGEPGKYAPESLSQRILSDWQGRDPGDLDVVEVGRGRPADKTGVHLGDYEVPFRVERASGVRIDGVAHLVHRGNEWRILDFDLNPTSLRVPSEGGPRIGSASAGSWAIAVAISVALMLLVAGILALTPKPAVLPTGGRGKEAT